MRLSKLSSDFKKVVFLLDGASDAVFAQGVAHAQGFARENSDVETQVIVYGDPTPTLFPVNTVPTNLRPLTGQNLAPAFKLAQVALEDDVATRVIVIGTGRMYDSKISSQQTLKDLLTAKPLATVELINPSFYGSEFETLGGLAAREFPGRVRVRGGQSGEPLAYLPGFTL